MQKLVPQKIGIPSKPSARQGQGVVADTLQTEQTTQLESIIVSSPQADKQGHLAAMMDASPTLSKFGDMLPNSPRQIAQRRSLDSIHNSPVMVAQYKRYDRLFGTAQKVEDEEPIQGKSAIESSAQLEQKTKEPNKTGLPDNLKSGIENLSGMSMDGVKVHYNSSEPAALNAHAYAQGADIHVAPGQEQHLPHEAWHIVQQAQGRVKPTMQMKDGVPVNDDTGLEHEADVMGERASQSGFSIQAKSTHAADTNISIANTAPVAQRRIPVMNLEFIGANKPMAVEILIHAMNNMDQKEFVALNAATSSPLWWGYDEIVAALEQGSPEAVYEWYQLIYEKSGEEKRYASTLNDPDSVEASELQTRLVNEKVGSVVLPGLGTLHGDVELQKLIFGPDCDPSFIQGVLVAIYQGLDKHISAKTCPMVMAGNKEHDEWVGVAGATTFGALQITIGKAGFNGVLSGTPRGLATLVHEFSHAMAGTQDHAYNISSLANLTTPKRMANAETYAQAFLEVISGPDPARYYDPKNITDTGKGHAKQAGNLNIRLAGINELIVALWNNVDNTYASLKMLATLEGLPVEAQEKMEQAIYAATFPHRPALHANPDVIMALIEDRAKVLKKYKAKGDVRKSLIAHKVRREQMEAEIEGPRDYINMAAIAMQDEFHMTVEGTVQFIENAIQIKQFNTEAVAIVGNHEKAKVLLPLIVAESAEVMRILETGAKAPYAKLSDLISQYKATGVNPLAVTAHSKVVTRAMGRAIQKT